MSHYTMERKKEVYLQTGRKIPLHISDGLLLLNPDRKISIFLEERV